MKLREVVLWFVLVAVLTAVVTISVDLGSRLYTLESQLRALMAVQNAHLATTNLLIRSLPQADQDSLKADLSQRIAEMQPDITPEAGEEGEASNGTE